MANAAQGNSVYIDATGVIVVGILVTATSASAVLVLQDASGSTNKLDLRVATSGDSKFFDFSSAPITFPNGIKASTVTNAKCAVIYN